MRACVDAKYVVPPRHDGKEFGLRRLSPEVDRKRAVFVGFRLAAVDHVFVVRVSLKIPILVIKTDGPESAFACRHIFQRQGVGRIAIVSARNIRLVNGMFGLPTAPGVCC